MKVSSYDSEKGFSTSLDSAEPNPGTSGGTYFSTDASDEEDDDGNAVVRSIRFESAPDSNVKVDTVFDHETGALRVIIGVYYV